MKCIRKAETASRGGVAYKQHGKLTDDTLVDATQLVDQVTGRRRLACRCAQYMFGKLLPGKAVRNCGV